MWHWINEDPEVPRNREMRAEIGGHLTLRSTRSTTNKRVLRAERSYPLSPPSAQVLPPDA